MGFDTRYWGPSAWELFHLITFTKGQLSAKKRFFTAMVDVLPCKYCRASSNEFLKELPLENNLAFWLYKFHDRVNRKLEDQHMKDPSIEKPKPSPPFEEIVKKYSKIASSAPKEIPGRDFLFTIASNYQDEPYNTESHQTFWKELVRLFPFYEFRKHMKIPNLQNYFNDVYDMLSNMKEIPSRKGILQRLAYYKSGCSKKSYKGKTCRKLPSGGYTKDRDRKRTYRISHANLLSTK